MRFSRFGHPLVYRRAESRPEPKRRGRASDVAVDQNSQGDPSAPGRSITSANQVLCHRESTLARSQCQRTTAPVLSVSCVESSGEGETISADSSRGCQWDALEREKRNGSRTGERVGLAGIEPATSALSVLRSNRLSYSPDAVPELAGGRSRLHHGQKDFRCGRTHAQPALSVAVTSDASASRPARRWPGECRPHRTTAGFARPAWPSPRHHIGVLWPRAAARRCSGPARDGPRGR